MTITIDQESGFCFGVINAIKTAEEYLSQHQHLYCLGDIVHNNEEVKRLVDKGLQVVNNQQFAQLHHTTVLIRAHGEPPETYQLAQQNHITLIDATCPVVLHLQNNIKKEYENSGNNRQILIFGKKGHAEVTGLLGQTHHNGLVLSSLEDIENIDFQRPATLYSQTTQGLEDYYSLIHQIEQRYTELGHKEMFSYHDTICRLVSNRSKHLQQFATQHDIIIFVSGEKSSNGLYLFDLCKKANPQSHFISHIEQLRNYHFPEGQSIGICGATSTPMWLMEEIRSFIETSAEKR
ncbi:MAG: 4-hydroxy-3-methylbut-2-enyl diphosphate reductase [Bacteroidales bacterium]|nr:4-hydroxy-3-methylbut-2-enyl diphosphate reductase [Bacteroidales bacterium]